MISSMTGYGRGEAEGGGQKWVVEMRSINHRFLEISLNLHRSLWALEDRCRKLIKSRLHRGRVEVQLTWEGRPEAGPGWRLDPVQVAEIRTALEVFRASAEVAEPLRLDHFLPFLELVVSREKPQVEAEEAWPWLSQALEAALANLEAMRRREGESLAAELEANLTLIRSRLEQIAAQAEALPRRWRERLQERLRELEEELGPLDEGRLAQEVAYLADRRDVSEEVARLESHLSQFSHILAAAGPVGRKLEFLLQEILREANTIGAKAGDLDVSQAVLDIKGALERLREQVQNIE
ncbi:MAG: YicC family protein [Deltaproteobacteria bacterium]|nr:YicC family protein [Deltaproteobacteria bacterium]